MRKTQNSAPIPTDKRKGNYGHRNIISAIPIVALMLLTILFPFIGLLAAIPFYFRAKSKREIVFFSILMGILVGFFAFNFIPLPGHDLTKWHNIVNYYSSAETIADFFRISSSLNLEIIPKAISFLISKTGNTDLLQFFMVGIGYSSLFYILADYKARVGLSNLRFLPIFILVLFGQSTLYYFSGLYNYVAINLFALGFYLDYSKKRKVIPYILYILPVLIHNGMFLPLALILAYKLFGNRLSIKFVVFALLIPISLTGIVSILVNQLGITALAPVQSILNMYVTQNDYFKHFYAGEGLLIDISKIIITLLACFITRKDNEKKNYCDFIIVFSITTILLLPLSIVMIRFAALALFLGIPPIIDTISNDHLKLRKYLYLGICVCAIAYAAHCIHAIYPYGYNDFIVKKLPTTTSEFFVKQKDNSNE